MKQEKMLNNGGGKNQINELLLLNSGVMGCQAG
jgi:hypothetical protein